MATGATPHRVGVAQARRRSVRRNRVLTALASVAGHLAILVALLSAHRDSLKVVDIEPMSVELAQVRPVAVVPTPPAAAPPAPVEPPPPPRNIARPTRAPVHVDPLPASDEPTGSGVAELSEAQIASAATAGSGPSGRPCDMARRLQAALRKDSQVQAAVADAHRAAGTAGKPMFVWNGDWVRHPGQDGNGLAAVREAIMWEVAFSPEACRAEPVHGLVLISLNDGPGASRLVVGSGEWRWSDLLRPRRGG